VLLCLPLVGAQTAEAPCAPAGIPVLAKGGFEVTRVHDWRGQRAVTIHPAYYPSTQSYYPSGRVYLYRR